MLNLNNNNGAPQRAGNHPNQADQDSASQPSTNTNSQLPASVSGGGVIVGLPINSGTPGPIPGFRVILINGRNYSVGFLKQQVNGYANSSYANSVPHSDGAATAQAAVAMPWGGGSPAAKTRQFERYISDTFPAGDPNVPINSLVRYEGRDSLIVNGQAYAAHLTDPQLVGRVNSLLIENKPEHQDAIRELLVSLGEIRITNDFSKTGGGSGFTVTVPSDYYGQWRAALMDKLPAGSGVNIPAQDGEVSA